MGKVKKLRQKYHLSIKKSLNNLPENLEKPTDLNLKTDLFKSNENIFSGIDISIDELSKSLPHDFDARSVISSKSRKEIKEERHLKKKEKQKRRHERFLNKLEFTHKAIQDSKASRKKQKKTCSMNSFLDGLPQLEPIPAPLPNCRNQIKESKPRGVLKAKHRLKQQSVDSKVFKKILDNKQFKMNPFDTITEFLRVKVSNT